MAGVSIKEFPLPPEQSLIMYDDDQRRDRRLPLAPLERRGYGYLLDFVVIWLFSSLTAGWVQLLIFVGGWFTLRVILVSANQGQSLGGWAFDTRVVHLKMKRLPGILELSQREGILGVASYLAMVGLNINFANGVSFLLLVAPLFGDLIWAIAEDGLGQAFHDRIAGTVVLSSRRGFSLDLRLKKFWFDLKKQWDSRQRKR